MNHFILSLQNLDLLSVGIAVAGMTVLGFTVLFNNFKSASNRSFFFLAIVASVWGIVNYAAYQPHFVEISLWLWRLVMFFGVLASFFTYTFAYVFPSNTVKFPSYYKGIIISLTVVTLILTITPLVFSEIAEVAPDGRIARVIIGPGIFVFAVTVIFLNFGGIAVLIRKVIGLGEGQRRPLQIVLVGIAIMLVLIIVFNFILPAFFDNQRFIPLGGVFLFPFIASAAYAILRHKLFNVRVAGTAVLVFLLSVITFFEVILAGELALIIYRGSILLLILVFGVLLIRGVMREVEQKEKLAELNKKLQLAYEEVDRLSKAKSEFISIASHQLRTPLSAIKGYLSMLIEGTYGKLSERSKVPMENVYKSNERLIKLVNDLLSISRIEAGKMEFEPQKTQIEEIIGSVVGELQITAQQKKLYLNWEKPKIPLPKLMLDKDKIRQVILNIVHNAIKYTLKGGVTITQSIINNQLLIVIKDTGAGMNREDLGKLFETFSKGTITTQASAEGAGLGLYIARKFVEMHGGKVWAESAGRDKGSTFYIELPMK